MKMITLKKWAERLDPAPHPNTLRNWTRQGNIIPAPIKIGRSYFVVANARHISEVVYGPQAQIS